jgi:hypothetical protein
MGSLPLPHLFILCNFQVWEASTKQASGGNADTGAIARLHSALMAVITHLIGRLRHAAMANEQVRKGGGEQVTGRGG